MSSNSICFAGLSREEEAEITAMFHTANSRVGDAWRVVPETDAHALVIDMDSMYGQMSLMKALGSGKTLVALTTSGRADTDHALRRPVTVEGLVDLLEDIAGSTSRARSATAQPNAPAPEPVPVPATSPAPTPSSAAQPTMACAEIASEPDDKDPGMPAPSGLASLLVPGALPGPVRLQLTGAPDLVLDPATQTFLGGSALKPLLPYCAATLGDDDLVPVAAAEMPAISAALGGPRPWSRLAWLCALSGGNGALAPGYGINDRYKLLRWPQTEREFPKHFRIATVMMKGPANLSEIAEHSGSSLGEVIDFVNACLASGVVEPDLPSPVPVEGNKGGLLRRFRR